MFAAGIVETVDVLEEGIADLAARYPGVPPDQFRLEGFEEGFGSSIVVAVSSPAHGHFEACFTQPLLIIMGTILTATIGVMKAAWWRVAKRHGIVQSLQCQIKFQAIAGCPTDDTARMQINHHRQIKPAFSCPDISDIAHPLLVWLVGMEVPVQPIWSNVEAMVAVSCCFAFMGSDHVNAIIPHQSPYAPMPNAQADLLQLLRHMWASVAPQTEMMLFANMGQQDHILALALADRAITPSPEPP